MLPQGRAAAEWPPPVAWHTLEATPTSSAAVHRMDYDRAVAEHEASGAATAIATIHVDAGEAGRYGVVQAHGGRITDDTWCAAAPGRGDKEPRSRRPPSDVTA